MGLQHNMV